MCYYGDGGGPYFTDGAGICTYHWHRGTDCWENVRAFLGGLLKKGTDKTKQILVKISVSCRYLKDVICTIFESAFFCDPFLTLDACWVQTIQSR